MGNKQSGHRAELVVGIVAGITAARAIGETIELFWLSLLVCALASGIAAGLAIWVARFSPHTPRP